MWYWPQARDVILKSIRLLALLLLSVHAQAASNYRDLNYQIYFDPDGQYQTYLKPISKELELHFQSGMPEIPLQQYPLEPTTLATPGPGGGHTPEGSCNPQSTSLAVTQISNATLASDYKRTGKVVHGDWNHDGKMDVLALALISTSPDSYLLDCNGDDTYLLIEITNNGWTSSPTLKYLFIPASSRFGVLLQQWASGSAVPTAIDMDGDHKAESLEFSTFALNASGNPTVDDVTPANGIFSVTTVNSTNSTIQTGDTTPPLSSDDVNSPDPSQILPRLVGATGGSYSVGLDGSANYTIPLALPAAVGGIQPSLALNYSSSGGNGNLGFGWGLGGQSNISRCGKILKQDGVVGGITFTTADQFCLDGARLILKSGTHGAAGAEYRLENEVFAKVVVTATGSDGMPTSFTVQGSEGSVSIYGDTTDSKILANGPNANKIIDWALSRVKDRYSNYRDYHYTQNISNGSYVLHEIDYGGNLTVPTSNTNKVLFDYSANPVGYLGYLQGSTLSTPQILTKVSVYDGTTELRFYALRYQTVPGYGEAYRMESVSECSGAGYCLSPTKFTWASGGSASFAAPVTSGANNYSNINTNMITGNPGNLESFIDMNGDGRVDRVTFDQSGPTLWVALSNNHGNFDAPTAWSNNVVVSASGLDHLPGTPDTYINDYAVFNDCNNYQNAHGNCALMMADVNGDGLPDAVYVPLGWSNTLHQNGPANFIFVALNTGSSLQTPVVWLNTPIDKGQLQLADMNGDGLSDAVIAGNCSATCDIEVALSTGSSFATPTTWLAAGAINNYPDIKWDINNNYPDYSKLARGQFLDVNGDGLPDRVWIPSGTSDVYVALNTGNSFATPSIWLNHTTTLGSFSIMSTDVAWEGYADLNGDGLPDRYWVYDYGSGPELDVALNDGTKFLTPYVWFYDTVIDARPQAGAALTFADVNDDGLVDMLWQPHDSPNQVEVALQEAGSFGRASVWFSGFSHSTTGHQAFIDKDGDGLVDYAWFPGTSTTTMNVAMANFKPASELVTVTNGFGHQTTFTYNSLTNSNTAESAAVYTGCGMTYPNSGGQVCLQNSARVVQHVDVSNGIGGSARSSYSYGGLRVDIKTRQSLGFAQITVKNEVTGLQDTTYYSQDIANNKQGMITETQTVDTATSYVLSDTNNTWQVNVLDVNDNIITPVLCNGTNTSTCSKNVRYIRQLLSTSIVKHDLLNKLLYTENNTYSSYDSYGHIQTQTTTEYDSSNTLLKTTTINNTFKNDTTLWLLGLSDTVTVNNTISGSTRSRTSSWVYDSNEQLLSEKIWSDSSKTTNWLTTAYSNYDGFGHARIVAVSGPDFATRSSSTTYDDASGRYVTSATNALSQTVSSTYYDSSTVSSGHYPGLVQTATDVNGVVSSQTYDAFGRPATTTAAYGTSNAVTSTNQFVNCTSLANDCASIHAIYAITSTAQGGTTTAKFYDVLGRVVRNSGQILGGTTVYVDSVFDSSGNNTQTSEPYSTGQSLVWNTATYDKLGRVISSTQPEPGGTRTDTINYNQYTITSYADTTGLNQKTIAIKNALGQQVKSTDDAGNILRYYYNVDSQLTSSVDSSSNTISISYDSMGRKISMVDPDKGTWRYGYNTLGQLIAQKNARNEVTCMAYDLLGRMTKRVDYYTGNAGSFSSTPGVTGLDSTNNCANPGSGSKTSTWTYDTATHGIGKLASASLANASEYSETHSYDSLSRPINTTKTIKSNTYATDVSYDSLNRPLTVTYPGPTNDRFAITNVYDSLGFLTSVNDAANSSVHYWQPNAMDVRGNITSETFGNGVNTTHSYDSSSGLLSGISTTKSGMQTIQDISVAFDHLGNLTSRGDTAQGYSESFTYLESDSHNHYNRLTNATANFGNSDVRTVTVSYDTLGNITNKSDVGAYVYGTATSTPCANGSTRPHAVCSISGTKNATYVYDANGDQTSGDNRALTYNAFDLPTVITRGNVTSSIDYGPDHQRYHRSDAVTNNSVTSTTDTIQVDGLYEKVTMPNGDVLEKHYIGGFAVKTIKNRSTCSSTSTTCRYTNYLHKDHLGSLTAVTDDSGNIVEFHNYDAWGLRRNLNGATMLTIIGSTPWTTLSPLQLLSSTTTQGYTGQEMFDGVDVIHMNARTYDPEIGRFMQADSTIQDSTDLQAFNRYSYVRNNPLAYTDPSGNSWLGNALNSAKRFLRASLPHAAKLAFQVSVGNPFGIVNETRSLTRETGRLLGEVPALQIVADAVILYVTCGAGMALVAEVNAAISASVIYASGGNFGDCLKGAAISYATSAVWSGVGTALGSSPNIIVATLAHAVVGGAISKAEGNGFRQGEISAGLGELGGNFSFVGAAIAGGEGSRLAGGKFSDGAVSATVAYIFNTLAHSGKQLNSHVLDNPRSYMGDDEYINDSGNHECVMFPQQADDAPLTKYWAAGDSVTADTPIGTWVATFDSNGNFSGHVGAFESMDSAGNMKLIDQFNSAGSVQETIYHVKPSGYSGSISNDPSKYRILLW